MKNTICADAILPLNFNFLELKSWSQKLLFFLFLLTFVHCHFLKLHTTHVNYILLSPIVTMSNLTTELQAWWNNTQDPGVQPDESDYLSQEKVKDIIKNCPKEMALIDLRKNDFIVSATAQSFHSMINCTFLLLSYLLVYSCWQQANIHQGGKIKGALNLPAQGIHNSIDDLYDLFKASGKKEIVVYCGKYFYTHCHSSFSN